MTVRSDSLPVEGGQLCGLAWLDGLLWYSDAGLEAIIAVDPLTGSQVSRLPCPRVRGGLTAVDGGGGQLIQVVGADRRLRVLDAYTGRQLAEYPNPRPGTELYGLHDTPGGLWMGFRNPSAVELRRHADLAVIISIPLEEDVAGVTVARGALVFADQSRGRLSVLDAETGQVGTRLLVGGNPAGLTWDGRRLWYCDSTAGRLCAVEVEPRDLGLGS